MYGRVIWIFRRLAAIWRREGFVGICDRIRNPKPIWRSYRSVTPICGVVRIVGGSTIQRQKINDCLDAFDIRHSMASGPCAAAKILIDPAPETATELDQSDILILSDCSADVADSLIQAAHKCKAVIGAQPGTIAALLAAGLPREQVFSLPADGDLSEGFTRFLIAAQGRASEWRDWRVFGALRNLPARPRLCLGLPETLERRENFMSQRLSGFRVFDGIRNDPGWIGAAASFSTIAEACLEQGCEQVLICEDDVSLPVDFSERLTTTIEYLEGADWDVFSGLLTDIGPDYAISQVERYQGQTFIHLNHCVGMVFGIYRPRALRCLTAWPGASGTTIDRHLEQVEGLRVVTTLPFLVGHSDGLISSIWRFRNRRYSNMILRSQARLNEMLRQFET